MNTSLSCGVQSSVPQQAPQEDLGSCLNVVRFVSPHAVNLTHNFADALLTSALTHIILDVSHRDSKLRNVLDIPETRDEVFKTVIGAPKVLQGLRQGKIQLVLL